MDYNARMKKLMSAIQADADVVALVPGENLRYFTGLHKHTSERPMLALLAADEVALLVPELELMSVQQHIDASAQLFRWTDDVGYTQAMQQAVAWLNGRRLGVDGMTMRVFEWFALGAAGLDLNARVDVGQALLQVRATKSQDEIAALRAAIALSEDALRSTMQQVKPGMTELQIAALLSDEMGKRGSEGHAFGPAVQSGPRSAEPHGYSVDRVLEADDVLLIDFGGIRQGYPADITRTFVFGNGPGEDDTFRRMYAAVLAANEAARDVARPGVRCGDVDKAARDVITAAGFGAYFQHRTGHGLGLAVHELPQIAANVDAVLEPGMVFTIEPGVYIEGVGGVRIEDDVLVTADGLETLTSYPRAWGALY